MSRLEGLRVLAVEDEPVVAMTLEDILCELGCQVIGPASRLEAALALAAAEPIDAAVLDVHIGERRSYEVARLLERRGIPYVFATGYGASGIDPGFEAVPVIDKPYRSEDIEAGLVGLIAGGAVADDPSGAA